MLIFLSWWFNLKLMNFWWDAIKLSRNRYVWLGHETRITTILANVWKNWEKIGKTYFDISAVRKCLFLLPSLTLYISRKLNSWTLHNQSLPLLKYFRAALFSCIYRFALTASYVPWKASLIISSTNGAYLKQRKLDFIPSKSWNYKAWYFSTCRGSNMILLLGETIEFFQSFTASYRSYGEWSNRGVKEKKLLTTAAISSPFSPFLWNSPFLMK